jgi:hypothetical protein
MTSTARLPARTVSPSRSRRSNWLPSAAKVAGEVEDRLERRLHLGDALAEVRASAARGAGAGLLRGRAETPRNDAAKRRRETASRNGLAKRARLRRSTIPLQPRQLRGRCVPQCGALQLRCMYGIEGFARRRDASSRSRSQAEVAQKIDGATEATVASETLGSQVP